MSSTKITFLSLAIILAGIGGVVSFSGKSDCPAFGLGPGRLASYILGASTAFSFSYLFSKD